MKNTHIIIVADTGSLKAYRVSERSLKNRSGAEVIKKIDYELAHRKLSDLPPAGRNKNLATGEEHNMREDLKKKAIKHLAHDIEGIISHTPAEFFYVSLPKPVHRSVMDQMKRSVRDKITKEVAADLIKEPVGKIRERFNV